MQTLFIFTDIVNVAYSDWNTFTNNVSIGDEFIVVDHYTQRGQ